MITLQNITASKAYNIDRDMQMYKIEVAYLDDGEPKAKFVGFFENGGLPMVAHCLRMLADQLEKKP